MSRIQYLCSKSSIINCYKKQSSDAITLESGFRQWIERFSEKQLSEIYALLDNYREKDIVIFKSREEADKYVQYYRTSEKAS